MLVKSGPKTLAEHRTESARIPGVREPAPKDLEPGAAAYWEAIVVRLPVDWFSSETIPLLKAYCRHSNYADQFAHDITVQREQIALLEAGVKNRTIAKRLSRSVEHLVALHRAHGYESDRAVSIATKLRLTIQSKYVPEKAASKARSNTLANAPPPWRDWNTHASPEANA
jgi:hypothetical protein